MWHYQVCRRERGSVYLVEDDTHVITFTITSGTHENSVLEPFVEMSVLVMGRIYLELHATWAVSDLTLLHTPYLQSELSDVYPNEEFTTSLGVDQSLRITCQPVDAVHNTRRQRGSLHHLHTQVPGQKHQTSLCQHPPLIAYHLSRSPYCPQKSISRSLSGQVPLRAEQVPLRAGPSQSRSLSGWVLLRAGPSQSRSLSALMTG